MQLKGYTRSLYTLDVKETYCIDALLSRLRNAGGLLEYNLPSGIKTLLTVYSYYYLLQPIVQKRGQSHHCLLAIEKLPS
jgi:hypothetical protein